MTLQQITDSTDAGIPVYWHNEHYVVTKGRAGYFIYCAATKNCRILAIDGVLQEDGKDFFTKGESSD